MPSLDGYSLNEKMVQNIDRIDNEIKQLRNKIDNELTAINLEFNELKSYIKTIKPIKGSNNAKKESGKVKEVKLKKESKLEDAKESV